MKMILSIALTAILALSGHASFAQVQVLSGVTFDVQEGEVFSFLGPSGSGKSTLISITTGFVTIGEGDDLIIADLDRRDIYAPGPGGLMSLSAMAAQFTGGAAPQGSSPGTGAITDPDAAFEALFAGMPPTLRATIQAQIDSLPPEQAIQVLEMLRGQMSLPPIDLNDLPQRADSGEAVVRTGNTERRDGVVLEEYIVAGDRIWTADAGDIEGGARLNAGLTAFGEIFDELASGMPVDDSSFFLMGELDGRVPYHVITQDGESFTYESTTIADIAVPRF